MTTPTVFLERLASQTLPQFADTPITWDHKVWDNNSFWGGVSNTTKLIVRAPGLYLVGGSLQFKQGSNSERTIEIRINGTQLLDLFNKVDSGGAWGFLSITSMYYFHNLDYVEILGRRSGTTDPVGYANAWMVAITPEAII